MNLDQGTLYEVLGAMLDEIGQYGGGQASGGAFEAEATGADDDGLAFFLDARPADDAMGPPPAPKALSLKDLPRPIADLLRPHQRRAVEAIETLNTDNWRGLYYVLQVGAGKSYIMGAIMSMALQADLPVRLVIPASTHAQIDQILAIFGLAEDPRIHIHHHDSGLGQRLLKEKIDGVVWIIDEAHWLLSGGEADDFSLVLRSWDIIGRSCLSWVFLLSATPVYNSVYDLRIINLLLADGWRHAGHKIFPTTPFEYHSWYGETPTADTITTALQKFQGGVFCTDLDTGAPVLRQPVYVPCPFNKKELDIYTEGFNLRGDIIAIGRAMRARTVSAFSEAKIAQLLELLGESQHMVILYTDFPNVIEPILEEPRFAPYKSFIFASKVPHAAEALAACNEPGNQKGARYKLAVLGPNSAIGLNFFNVDTIVFLSPPKTYALYTQVCGRAIRPQSLAWLPRNKRAVSIYIYNNYFVSDMINVGDLGYDPATVDQRDSFDFQTNQALSTVIIGFLETLTAKPGPLKVGGAQSDDFLLPGPADALNLVLSL